MIEDALNIAIQAIDSGLEWFTSILDAVDAGAFYIAMVFIALACGFLLSNFKIAMYVGSDVASTVDKAAYRGKYDRSNPMYKPGILKHGRFERR